jgi:hypothetical protein
MKPEELYNLLAPLQPGDLVPSSVYVADYADGTRPAWTVVEREEIGAGGVRLVLEDATNGDMFDCVRLIVLSFESKTLRTPPQPHGLSGQAVIGDKLCDMLQQDRYNQKRAA